MGVSISTKSTSDHSTKGLAPCRCWISLGRCDCEESGGVPPVLVWMESVMRSIQETRAECLRLANILASTKVINHDSVLYVAESYFKWIMEEKEIVEPASLEALVRKFR